MNFTTLAADLIVDMEIIDLTANGRQSITLNAASVKNMTDDRNELLIQGDTAAGSEDVVTASGGWIQGADQVIDTINYHVFTHGTGDDQLHLKIQEGLDHRIT